MTRSTPVHATLRFLPHVGDLRAQRSLAVIEAALEGAKAWRTFRVVHFSVRADELHLVVEADGGRALSTGMQGLCVRIARGLNRVAGRRGTVFADRYDARVLATPGETREALARVLLDHRGGRAPDRSSSAPWFDGWKGRAAPADGPRVTSAPRTWLLATGWRRHGLLSPGEARAARA